MVGASARVLAGNILGATGWVRGKIAFGERIDAIDGTPSHPAPHLAGDPANGLTDGDVPYILPGFVDLHVHGGGGADFTEGVEAAETIARLHARHGTTALLATTLTAPPQSIERVVAALGQACRRRPAGTARLLGVHLEGPYLSAGRLGAQPDHARQASLDELARLRALAPICVVTLAPEVEGHLDAIRALVALGIRVQLGHTSGSYEDAVGALREGASGFTHLYNAMTGLQHREPGMVGAALAHAEYAELIPDLHHVSAGAIHAALRAIPRLYCVTDATAAAGMPDGDYRLGAHAVAKTRGAVRLLDGTLAGSALTMDEALRNLVALGLSLDDASHRLSRYPAEHLGLSDRGRLQPGGWADLVVLDRALGIIEVVGEGHTLWPRGGG
jgi:N-acetylglucosamine-6-phosphate deacetylase